MAPRKRRGVEGSSITVPPASTSTQAPAVNPRGFAALADEIYLEIVSHIPSVPIPTSIHLESYSEIRRSRHETFLSLSQTSRSLRRFFWRYLWQRIEVREGMKIWNKDDTLKIIRTRTATVTGKKFAVELVRQLEIVTVRNPQLAQYVNYLDIFIGPYSIESVLAELARCLSLFSNLHTVQIDVVSSSIDVVSSSTGRGRRSYREIFEQTFKKYSYPQIHNVFVKISSVSFLASCPQARRVGFKEDSSMSDSCLRIILGKCPHLEVLEDLGEFPWVPDAYKRIVDSFPKLRTIQFMTYPGPLKIEHQFRADRIISYITNLENLNHLQTIIMKTPPSVANVWYVPPHELGARIDRVKEEWIEAASRILIQIQLRDNLEKTVVMRDYDGGSERRILIKPKSSFEIEGSLLEVT